MNASILDLRYRTSDILAALENRERVTILYHGKPRGTIIPLEDAGEAGKVCEHELFGMYTSERESVSEVMDRIRGSRHYL